MSKQPQDASAGEPDGGTPHVRIRGGPGWGNQPGRINKHMVVLFVLLPVLVHAGISYDETQISLSRPLAAVRHFYLQDGAMRSDSEDGKTTVLLTGQTMYLLDNVRHSFRALSKASIEQKASEIDQLSKMNADKLSAEQMEELKKSAALTRYPERKHQFLKTDRSTVVDGISCRVWEESEGGAKHLELCVADSGAVIGGKEIIDALERLDQFFTSRSNARGTELGPEDWWNDIDKLAGLPISIKFFSAGAAVSEIKLSGEHEETFRPELFAVPANYQIDASTHDVRSQRP